MCRSLAAVLLSSTVIGGLSGYPPPPKDTKPEADKTAKEFGEAFLANVGKRDFDAVLKTVEYPYRTSDGRTADKPEAVKKELAWIVSSFWTEDSTVAVKDVVAADKFEAWAGALPLKPEVSKTDDARKALLERIGPGGRVVALQFTIDGKKDDDLCLLLVRIKDRKASLVGLVD
jgi:hypothetical protein